MLNTLLNPSDHRESHERHRLAERASGFNMARGLMRLRLDLADERFDEARRMLADLEALFAGRGDSPALFFARSNAQLGDDARALTWIGRALERDPDDAAALALAARLHLRNRRFAAALDAAAESLARSTSSR